MNEQLVLSRSFVCAAPFLQLLSLLFILLSSICSFNIHFSFLTDVKAIGRECSERKFPLS